MKKLLSILLSVVMVFSFAAVSVSAEVVQGTYETTKGSITIESPSTGTQYKVYRLFELSAFNKEEPAYTYVIGDTLYKEVISGEGTTWEEVVNAFPWREFFETGYGKDYFTFENEYEKYYTEQVGGETVNYKAVYNVIKAKDNYNTTTAVDLAKEALKFAKTNNIEADETELVSGSPDKIVFDNLPLGYYLIDTSVGVLSALTTTDADRVMAVKNSPPELSKSVVEDDIHSGDKWREVNDAAFGEIVEFDITINAKNGAQDYVLHDKMQDGLELIEDSFELVMETDSGNDADDVTLVPVTHYIIETPDAPPSGVAGEQTCTFEIIFTETLCNMLKTNYNIVVKYEAKLNPSIELVEGGLENEAWVTYGDFKGTRGQLSTTSEFTYTKTYGFDIVKTDDTGKMLDGAKFMLYNTESDADAKDNAIAFIKLADNKYRLATPEEVELAANEGTIPTGYCTEIQVNLIGNKSVANLIGFDRGTYYLVETSAPTGFNPLDYAVPIVINGDNNFAEFNGNGEYNKTTGVHVENKTGTVLPGTGGMGTTLFVTFGAIVALGAGVLLVTKKRMSMIED